MPIRFGTNPIGWSNDDMPELGGDTPLEQCLSEAKQAGFEGMELGNKFPREPVALKKVLSALRARSRLRLVLGRTAAAHAETGDGAPAPASRPAEGARRQRAGLRRDHRRASRPAAVEAPGAEGEPVGRSRQALDRDGRHDAGRRRPPHLPPSHGHRRPGGSRDPRHDGGDRPVLPPAARYRPRHLGRFRSGGAGAPLSHPHQPLPRQGRAQGRHGAGRMPRTGRS